MSYDWGTYRDAGHRLVVTAVLVAERLAKTADRFLRPFRLTLAQFNLLAVLVPHRHGLPQSRIGAELVVSRANVTGLVRRMKGRGLCRVDPDPADERVKRVRITPAGRTLLDRIERPYFREIGRLTRRLSVPEMKRGAKLLDRLASGI